MAATFRTPGRIMTGWGCAEEVGSVAAGLGRHALLVTGRKALRAEGTTDRLTDRLSDSDVEVTLFAGVEPEPSVETVDAGREAFAQAGCDLVVAAGGGSAMDAGKAIAALASEGEPTREYFARCPVPRRGYPCVALPTTAGTGAEATPNSVLTDEAAGIKQSVRGESLMPAAAIVDAELSASSPPEVTAAAGADALTQAIESYLSLHATSLTDALAIHAAELIWLNILAAYQDGRDRAAREAMAEGALMAGIALANARLGAVHGIAHAVGHRYRLRHGVVCAALLPGVLRFNRQAVPEKYGILADTFETDPAEAAAGLLVRLGLPARLGPFGLRQRDFDAIAAESLPSGSLKANPRAVAAEDIKAILAGVM